MKEELTKEKVLAEILGSIVVWLLAIAAGLATTYYAAFVMGYQWTWFLAPAGYPVPPIESRIGIMLIAALFTVAPLITIKMTEINPPKDAPPRKHTPKQAAFIRIMFIAAAITMLWGIGAFWNWFLWRLTCRNICPIRSLTPTTQETTNERPHRRRTRPPRTSL